MLDVGLMALLEFDEQNLLLKEDVKDTSKSIQAKIRIRQNKFRKNLLKFLNSCPTTGIDEAKILLASHIKSLALSNNQERLDISNGFIFSPAIYKSFDNGFICLEITKELIVSPFLTIKKYLINCNSIG